MQEPDRNKDRNGGDLAESVLEGAAEFAEDGPADMVIDGVGSIADAASEIAGGILGGIDL